MNDSVQPKTESQWKREGWNSDEINTFSKIGLVLADEPKLESEIKSRLETLEDHVAGAGRDLIEELKVLAEKVGEMEYRLDDLKD